VGWLRDLMEQSDSGCRSYGDLARAALKSTDWPNESRMGERSLASILSKLDRNQEADWLAERVGVQRVLSKVLGVPLDDVRGAATLTRPTPRGDLRRLRLTALRYARALDLVEEPLCPGIPGAVLAPGAYQSLFWRAPSGSGRSLVGRFLEARGLAQVLEADTFESALTRLPARGPAFIELHAAHTAWLRGLMPLERCVSLAGAVNPRLRRFYELVPARAAGEFAGMVQFDVPPEKADALTHALRGLESSGLQVAIARSGSAPVPAAMRALELELVGADRVGIVSRLTRMLAQRGISIDNLHTEIAAAGPGRETFRIAAHLLVPQAIAIDTLRQELAGLATEMAVDIGLGERSA